MTRRVAVATVSTRPVPDGVWITVRQCGSRFILNVVNLVGVGDDRWNVAKAQPAAQGVLTLLFAAFARVRRVLWASPDDGAPARDLDLAVASDGVTTVSLPTLDVWATIVVDIA